MGNEIAPCKVTRLHVLFLWLSLFAVYGLLWLTATGAVK